MFLTIAFNNFQKHLNAGTLTCQMFAILKDINKINLLHEALETRGLLAFPINLESNINIWQQSSLRGKRKFQPDLT